MYVYCIKVCDNTQLVKIGKSNTPEKRLKALQTGTPIRLELLYKIAFSCEEDALKAETLIHKQFRALKVRGEWFRFSKNLRTFLSACEAGNRTDAEAALRAHHAAAKKKAKFQRKNHSKEN